MRSRETEAFGLTVGQSPLNIDHSAWFYASRDIIVLLDANGRILDANPAALKKVGLPLMEAQKILWTDLISETNGSRLQDAIRLVQTKKIIIQTLEVEIGSSVSTPQFFEIDIIPFSNPLYPDAVILHAHDLTEHRQRERKLRESQTLYRVLVEDTDDIFFQMDLQGKITYISPSASRLGIPVNGILGAECSGLLRDDSQTVTSAIEHALTGSSETFELNTPSNRLLVSLRPILSEDRQVGVRGVLSDLAHYSEFDQILENRAARLATLNLIGREITSNLDLEEVLQNAVNLIYASFGYYHVAVFTPEEASGDAVMRSRAGSYAARFPAGHRLHAGQGMVGWVFKNHRTLLANDVTLESAYVNLYPDRIPSRSELTVPILIRDELAGALDLQSPQINAFTEEDIHVMETAASQMAVAIANAQLFAQAQERWREKQRVEELLRLQRDILAGPGQALNFQAALIEILEKLKPLALFDSGSIYLVEADGGMRSVADTGLTPEFATAVSYLPAEANKTRFVKLGQPGYMRYADLKYDPRIPPGVRQRENILFLAMLPILRQDAVVACLSLGSHTCAEITPAQRAVLEAVREQLGAVIARLKVERDLSLNKARDRALLEALPDFIFSMDRQGRFISAQPALDSRPEMSEEMFIGRHVGEVLPPAVATRLLAMLRRALETRKVQDFEYQIMREPDKVDHFEVRMAAASEDLVVAFVRNITQRWLAAQEAAKHTQEVEIFNERLLELDRMKSQFLANVSAELRSPLSSIIGFSEILRDAKENLAPAAMADYVESIHAGGLRLLNLVNDLLDFSRLETNRVTLDLSMFHLAPLLDEIRAAFSTLLNKSHQTLIITVDPELGSVTADRVRVKHILFNLVGNANKYSPEDSVIRLGARREGDGWLLSVADNGPGIPDGYHKAVFEGFRQFDPPNFQRAGGAGLGLAITRQLAEMHGGRIWLESVPGAGACFYVFFPNQPPQAG